MTGRRLASSTWPSIVVGALLSAGLAPSPCAAQAPPTNLPPTSGDRAANPVQGPAMTSPSAPIGVGAGAGTSAGVGAGSTGAMGLPPLPGAPGLGGPSAIGTGPMPGYPAIGPMQSPPVPVPPHPEMAQPPGPLPLAAQMALPSVTVDHYGDGSGTVGASLIWPHQPPHPHDYYGDGAGVIGGPIGPIGHLNLLTPPPWTVSTKGTLSYGPPGLHPGFPGFGLSFHPGYGYGGNGLGTGALGGYPCYGGPGYPIRYGYPHFAYPYYEGIGQLYYDPPVVITDLENASEFGPYTGASIYAYTHPSYASEAAATGSFVPGNVSFPDTNATNPSPNATFTPGEATPGVVNRTPMRNRFLGMDVEGGAIIPGGQGLRIINVIPGSTAANAGLQVGDVIASVNDRPTGQVPQMSAIMESTPAGNTLKMRVLKGGVDERTVTIRNP